MRMAIFDRVSQGLALFADATVAVKVALFFGSWGLIWLPIAVPLAIALRWHPPQPLTMQQKLPLVISLYLLAPPILWGFAWAESTPFSDYGLTWQLSVVLALSQGVGVGVIGLLILFGVQARWGWVIWQREQWSSLWPGVLPTLVLGLGIGAIEELIFRGFLLQQFSRLTSLETLPPLATFLVAAALASLLFALLHLVWEGAENSPQLPALWLRGMVLCLARWADHGSLGLAWGLHTGWIWGMASLETAQLVRYSESAPAWLTGVGQKPLAGLLGLMFLAITGGLVGLWGWNQAATFALIRVTLS